MSKNDAYQPGKWVTANNLAALVARVSPSNAAIHFNTTCGDAFQIIITTATLIAHFLQ
jgi:hypothetical protein